MYAGCSSHDKHNAVVILNHCHQLKGNLLKKKKNLYNVIKKRVVFSSKQTSFTIVLKVGLSLEDKFLPALK